MRNWIKAGLALVVLGLVGFAYFGATAQTQVEGYQLSVNSTRYMYKPLIDAAAAASATTWSIDSAAVDTSAAYQIVPGCFAAAQFVLNSAADSLDKIYIDGSMDGSSWMLIDSVVALLGTTAKIRYIHGPANGTVGAATPILCRWLRFRPDNDDDANAATVLTGYLVTSPTIND